MKSTIVVNADDKIYQERNALCYYLYRKFNNTFLRIYRHGESWTKCRTSDMFTADGGDYYVEVSHEDANKVLRYIGVTLVKGNNTMVPPETPKERFCAIDRCEEIHFFATEVSRNNWVKIEQDNYRYAAVCNEYGSVT